MKPRASALVVLLLLTATLRAQDVAPPRPPASVTATDHHWDNGTRIDVQFPLSPDDLPPAEDAPAEDAVAEVDEVAAPEQAADAEPPVTGYLVFRAAEYGGVYTEVATPAPTERDYNSRTLSVTIDKAIPGAEYFFRVYAVGPGGVRSAYVETTTPAVASQQWFDGERFWLLVISSVVCGSVVLFIVLARRGKPLKIRKIAGLEAIEEAVGRATEMGRPCLFVPGILDINDIQTIAGLTILSRVAEQAAEYDSGLEVPTSKSLVMTAARETVAAAFLAAGRPDAYYEDAIYYVTDEQFGYVAYLSGLMVREEPAACFYMGAFFAESLILAETGNAVGSIQIAGTAQPAQLPFFVAACDYTLIGEEFFAASAYLSRDPDQLGSLKGQDVGKIIVAGLMIVGIGLITLATVTGNDTFQLAADYLTETVLHAGS